MALDPELEKAVNNVVTELGQQEHLAKRLISWLRELSEGELTAQEDNERLELVRRAIRPTKVRVE